METGAIEGADVYDYRGDYLGEVSGFLVRAARPTHVLIGNAGFWEAGSDRAAVPASILRWNPESQAVFVPIAGETLEEASSYIAHAAWNPEANDRF